MIWVDRIATELGDKAQHIDDMFTPSGVAHIGSLRGPILHDVVYRVLHSKNKETQFTYVFNDFDPIDGLPPALQKDFTKYLGYPLRLAPSPNPKYKSFGEFFASEMKSVLKSLGVGARYLSSWDMYHEGKFNDAIRTALDNKGKILEVYRKVGGYKKKAEDWYPLQVICPKCNKVGTTKVIGWDGDKVRFECQPELVTWAKGCGYNGEISPFDGNAKLPWKVDWPAHWKTIGVTFEGAGKDHASRGGSYDIAFELCREVFDYPKPYYFPYEFFLFGGKKMSSSKGIGASSKDTTKILPPEVFRFLVIRTPIERTIEFNPIGDTIPNLFDDYDRCLNAYFDRLEDKIPEGKQGEVLGDFARIIELSKVRELPEKRIFLPRFRTVANLVKTQTDLLKFFEEQKGAPLTTEEKRILDERVVYAQIYLKSYAADEVKVEFLNKVPADLNLTDTQKQFLKELADNLAQKKSEDRDGVQEVVFSTLKKSNYQPRDVFKGFYQAVIGRDSGPKAADLILEFGTDKVIKRLREI